MYEPPIRLTEMFEDIARKITDTKEESIIQTVRMYVDVDKDELISALRYDRDQWERGYADGKMDGYHKRDAEIVRCKDCVHLSNDRIAPKWYRRCRKYGCGKADDGFCDDGERRE